VLHLFERLEVFAVDRRARLEPAFWRLARKQRRIEQDPASDHAVLQRNDAAFRTAVRRLHVLECAAVIALAVDHLVAIDGVEMAEGRAVVGPDEGVLIGRAARSRADHLALEMSTAVGLLFLENVMRQRDGDSLLDESGGLLPFGRRDEVRRPEFVVLAPAAPVRELGRRPIEIFLRRQGFTRLNLCRADEAHAHEPQDEQTRCAIPKDLRDR
jgi:hypothetical protein